jgi:hypothetical protein
MYADIYAEQYPPGWEELEWKIKQLKQLQWNYQLQVGRQAFGYAMGPTYQFTLIRWGTRPDYNTAAPREVLYEGHDYYAVLGFISLLLTAEQDKQRS